MNDELPDVPGFTIEHTDFLYDDVVCLLHGGKDLWVSFRRTKSGALLVRLSNRFHIVLEGPPDCTVGSIQRFASGSLRELEEALVRAGGPFVTARMDHGGIYDERPLEKALEVALVELEFKRADALRDAIYAIEGERFLDVPFILREGFDQGEIDDLLAPWHPTFIWLHELLRHTAKLLLEEDADE